MSFFPCILFLSQNIENQLHAYVYIFCLYPVFQTSIHTFLTKQNQRTCSSLSISSVYMQIRVYTLFKLISERRSNMLRQTASLFTNSKQYGNSNILSQKSSQKQLIFPSQFSNTMHTNALIHQMLLLAFQSSIFSHSHRHLLSIYQHFHREGTSSS